MWVALIVPGALGKRVGVFVRILPLGEGCQGGLEAWMDVPGVAEGFVLGGRRLNLPPAGALDGAEQQVFRGVLQGDEL